MQISNLRQMRLEFNGFFPFMHRVHGEVRGNSITFPPSVDFGQSYSTITAGVTVTNDTALKQSAYWRAINLLSSQIASFPIGKFKKLKNGDTERIFDDTVKLINRKVNRVMRPFIWRESMQANVLVNGNAYSVIEKNRGGKPLSLILLDSTNMTPQTNGVDIVYRYIDNVYNPDQILHIPGLSFDGIKGRAVLNVAAESMGVGLAMQKYSANFFKNGAKQSGVLMHPHALSDEAKGGIRKSFEKKMKDKEGGTMILDEGMKYVPIGIPPDQQQLLQSKQFSVQEIARWFGIPPYMLFEESRSTFNNISEQGISFVRYTLTQWVERWEAELDAKLLTEEEKDNQFFWKFNMNSLMRGNLKERMEAYRTGLDLGIYNIDEVRGFEDLNELPNGQGKKHIIQVNRTPIEKLGENGNNGDSTQAGIS